jgi:uracil-DNA glycosylase family 4
MHAREPAPRAARVAAGQVDDVAQLEEHAAACELCRLCRDRTAVVIGSGPHDAQVLVVAEAPGYHDDRTGRLLAGGPGELFEQALGDAGLTRDEVFLTSVVKCRPPSGRTPFPDEVEACEGWLFREIALVRPRVVVTLGTLALRLVTGRQERIREVHGQMLHAHVQGRDVVVWPLYHPAAALHVPTLAAELRADARALGDVLRGARARPAGSTPSVASPDEDAAAPGDEPQLTMEL